MKSNIRFIQNKPSAAATMKKQQSDADLALARRVISTQGEGEGVNLVISPLSIHILLGMITAGSSGRNLAQLLSYLDSESSEQLNSLFSRIVNTVLADGSPLGGPLLSTGNGLWVDRSVSLKKAYRDIVENCYNAVAESVDFKNQGEKAIAQVNEWAEKQTKGLIKQIIPPDSDTQETRLILANAVYFKGVWDQEFDASRTKERNFYLLNGSCIRAPFMTSWLYQRVRAFDGFKVLALPYRQGEDTRSFSMYIYLPDATDGLPSLVEKICSEPDFINRHLPGWMPVELSAFRVPLFKIAFEFEASEVMQGLGVVDLFIPGGLLETVENREDGEDLCVTRIIHKAFIEVNERGTEAAAVTEAEEDMGCGLWVEEKPPPLDFVADHPFFFVIREDTTGELLFLGQLLDPLADALFHSDKN